MKRLLHDEGDVLPHLSSSLFVWFVEYEAVYCWSLSVSASNLCVGCLMWIVHVCESGDCKEEVVVLF